jgi:hypothetical protein
MIGLWLALMAWWWAPRVWLLVMASRRVPRASPRVQPAAEQAPMAGR